MAVLRPGKVKRAPIKAHQSARKNLVTSLLAGPDESRPALLSRKAAALALKLLYASSTIFLKLLCLMK